MTARPSVAPRTDSSADEAFRGRLVELSRDSPSPRPRSIAYLILAFLVALTALVVFGRVDRIAVATGRVVPPGRVQTVQAAQAGVLTELLVREGDVVAKSQLVARLDPAVAEARRTSDESLWWLARLASARVDAELSGDDLAIPENAPAELVDRTAAQLERSRAAQRAAVRQEQIQLERLESELRASEAQVTELEQTLADSGDVGPPFRRDAGP